MRRFWGLVAAATALLGAAFVATAFTRVGFSLLEYNVAFAALLVGAVLAWPLLRRRRVVSVGMAYSGAVATATGFVMLYSKQLPLKEWITWWHSVTSVAFTLFFLAHWLLNHARLTQFTKRVLARARTAAPVLGAWVGVGAAFAWTWAAGRDLFHTANYLHLSTWAVFLGIGATYALWLSFRHPALATRLARPDARNRARALVDTSLFLACWASLLTGFALLYYADFLRGGDLKYVSKWWHTATSVLLLAIVALHIGFNARLLAAHARRMDRGATPDPSAEAPVAPGEG